MMGRISQRLGRFLTNAILILFSFSCIFPIIWIGYSSLKTRRSFRWIHLDCQPRLR